MPAPTPLRRPIPRAFLDRVSRDVLCRLLERHEAAVAAQGLSLAALRASAQIDRSQVELLWRALGAPLPALVPLHEELLSIADLATPAGQEALFAQDAEGALDRERGAEDSAAVAFLDYRPLFDRARPRVGGAQTRTFATFQSDNPRPLPEAADHAGDFARRMGEALEARGRTRHFRAHEWLSGMERHFELVYGRLAQSQDLLGKASPDAIHEVTAQVTNRSTERAHAIFHDDTLCLDVAGPDWIKEIVRRTFGAAYFGGDDHFASKETVNLGALLDLSTALSADGVPDVKNVALQDVTVPLADGSGVLSISAPADVTRSAAGRYVQLALREGIPTRASFLVTLTFKVRPVKVTIAQPGRIEFNRSDPRVVAAVRDWLVLRGFIALPAPMGDRRVEDEEGPRRRADDA